MNLRHAITVILFSFYSISASADGGYLGTSIGIVDTSIGGFENATNASLLAGYDVYTREIFAISAEAEFTAAVSDGDVQFSANEGKWDINTRAAYVAFRLGERLYMKTRYGIIQGDISIDFPEYSIKNTESGLSWGGTFGWMFSKHLGLQFDGTTFESDTTYWNLGLIYRF